MASYGRKMTPHRRRMQANVNFSVKLSGHARGALPSWDDIQEEVEKNGDNEIDYMKLMDAEYSRRYGAIPAYKLTTEMDDGAATSLIQNAKLGMSIVEPPFHSANSIPIRYGSEAISFFASERAMAANLYSETSSLNVVTQTELTEEATKNRVRKQVEYYFSEENLQKDVFLRQNMSADGFVPLMLIASFPCVKFLTEDINVIVEVLMDSEKVELSSNGEQVRPRVAPTSWPILLTTEQ